MLTTHSVIAAMNFSIKVCGQPLESLEVCTGTSASESEKARKWIKTSLFEGRAMFIRKRFAIKERMEVL
jgi:hypothetical protein